MERTSSLLEPVFAKLGITEGVRLIRIRNDWDKIFDKPLSLHMWPSKYSEGSLLLNVDSSVWVHQLSFHKSAILNKLGVYGVRDIRFRVGKISRRAQQVPDIHDTPRLSGEDSSFISGLVSGIGDAELREAIKGAAEKSFKAKRIEEKRAEK